MKKTEINKLSDLVPMIGKDIIAIRKKYGLSKRDFALLIGVHLATLYRWEKDEFPPAEFQRMLIVLMHDVARDWPVAVKIVANYYPLYWTVSKTLGCLFYYNYYALARKEAKR